MNLRGNKKKINKKKKKIGRGQKNLHSTWERMGEYYEEKTFKTHTKRKRDKYGEISNVIKKSNENVTRKNLTKAQTTTPESSKAKITIIHPRQRKKLCEQKNGGKQLKTVVIGKI